MQSAMAANILHQDRLGKASKFMDISLAGVFVGAIICNGLWSFPPRFRGAWLVFALDSPPLPPTALKIIDLGAVTSLCGDLPGS